MKLTTCIVLLASILMINTVQAVEVVAEKLPSYSMIYDDKANPFTDAKAAIALAQKTDRNVLIEIGGNWCTWCHKMDDFLEKNPDIYQALHQKYVLLKVNVSDSNENEAFMKSLPPTLGYPHMYVSTASGKMIYQKTPLSSWSLVIILVNSGWIFLSNGRCRIIRSISQN